MGCEEVPTLLGLLQPRLPGEGAKHLALMLKRTVGPWDSVFSQYWLLFNGRGQVFKDGWVNDIKGMV